MSLVAIIVGTFLSEDLTCIAVGLLIAEGRLDFTTGLAGCFLGLLIGDLGLWLLGRTCGRSLLGWPRLARYIKPEWIDRFTRYYERYGWQSIVVARFLPGARLPIYVGAGMLGRRVTAFVAAFVIACAVWTPLLVGSVALAGRPLAPPLTAFFGGRWMGLLLTAAFLLVFARLALTMTRARGRSNIWTAAQRIWRWEFWPAWIFYIPLLPWIAYLSIRHRGLSTITAANPGIPHGGIVGESKYEILRRLPNDAIVGTELINEGPIEDRVRRFDRIVAEQGWSYPLILKPDVGERGAGVRLVHSAGQAHACVQTTPASLLVQTYDPGPYEAGVFYCRMPGDAAGWIFSVTDKTFPVVIGDGSSTTAELIRRHPRLRMQSAKFLARLNGQAQQILKLGEPLRLAVAGNHCQGTMFRDGAHLITPELAARFDQVAREFDGFFFGRFDVRYADPDEFRAGRGFAVVELNGASSESTNLYDPSHSLLSAYRILFRQWRVLFEIGARNRAAGHPVTPIRELIALVRSHFRHGPVSTLSD